MKKIIIIALLFPILTNAQIVKFNPGADSTKTVTVEGYADIYFGFDFNHPEDANRPYSVTQHRHNEFNVNLAYVSLKYNASRVRAVFTPGFGTYMNSNYAAERITLKNIVEAYVGVKLFEKHDIWLDAGVFVAPYTTESAISFDQLLYSRTFGAEYSPYYLTGAKLSTPITKKLNLYLYLANGWQVIEDVNNPLAFGSSLEYKPTEKLTIVWNTYFGSEYSVTTPTYRGRQFSDLYFIYNPTKKLTLSLDVYAGRQKTKDSITEKSAVNWGQGNLNARYSWNTRNSVSARAEYFNDKHNVFIVPVTGPDEFECYSYSLGYNKMITDNVMFRMESRYFHSPQDIFFNRDLNPTNSCLLLIGGLTAKF